MSICETSPQNKALSLIVCCMNKNYFLKQHQIVCYPYSILLLLYDYNYKEYNLGDKNIKRHRYSANRVHVRL